MLIKFNNAYNKAISRKSGLPNKNPITLIISTAKVPNAFNARTKDLEQGLPCPVVITVYEDKSFDFIIKTTPASVLIKKAAGIKSGSGTPNSVKVGKVTRAQLEEIAKIKDPDLTAADMDAAVRTLSGSARSAGIEVEG